MVATRSQQLLLAIILLILLVSSAYGQTQISSATFSSSSATPGKNITVTAPADASGNISANTQYEVRYGRNNNEFITQYSINPGGGELSFFNFVTPDTLIIQRIDNGRQLIIFYELDQINTGPNPDQVDINSDKVENEDALYATGFSNAGYDNILVNSATNFANVERIDIIYNTGVVTSTPSTAVFPIIDRGGNDDIKVAAISGLDANGNPSSYYPNVIRVRNDDGDWGDLSENHTSLVMRRQSENTEPVPQTTLGTQSLHGTAIAFDEFGVTANEVVYGYSIFADDVTATGDDLVDYTNEANYPRNTGSNSGLDLIAGISTAVASDDNLTRINGPGGYKTDLDTWLKANVEVTSNTDGGSVTDWQDQWLGDHDATNLGTSPIFRDSSLTSLQDINFNPSVDFEDAVERGLQIANNSDFNTSNTFDSKVINIAFRTGGDISVRQQIYDQGDEDRGLNAYVDSGNLYVGGWNDPSGGGWGFNSVSTSTISTETEYILTIEFDGGRDGDLIAYLNGQQFGIASGLGQLQPNAATPEEIGLGNINNESRYHNGTTAASSFYGSIPEFIYCNEPATISAAGRNQIESYLAIKYGITLDQSTAINYVNSQGAVIFNTSISANIGGYLEYNKDIAGIGRDDESELLQLRSQSENDGSLVLMNRTSDAGIGQDNTWLIWGNNGEANTATKSLTMPSSINERLTKIWRVSEANTVGVVDISFDLTGLDLSANPNNFSILIADAFVSNDDNGYANFNDATVVSGATLNGNILTFTDVDLSNGQYFTLGTEFFICTPGNVDDGLALWLKADAETYSDTGGNNVAADGNNVDYWGDQSRNDFDAVSDVNTNRPTWVENAINFNPAINFGAGANETGFNLGSNYIFAPEDDGGLHIFSAITPESGLSGGLRNRKYIVDFGNTADGVYGLGAYADRAAIYADGNGNFDISPRASTFVVEGEFNDTGGTDDNKRLYLDGELDVINTPISIPDLDLDETGIGAANTHGQNQGPVSIGRSSQSNGLDNNAGRRFFGDMHEVLIFNRALTDLEEQKVRSYLAIKYGTTLTNDNNGDNNINQTLSGSIVEGDYVASDGTTLIWDYSEDTDFVNNIAGIGRDDKSCLEQKQSRSVNSDAILTIGLGEIALTNADNSHSFDEDLDFLTWAADNGETTFANRTQGVTGIGTVTERMTRIWRAQDNGEVGQTEISFDLSGLGFTGSLTDYQLIVSNSSSLSSPQIFQAVSFNSDILTFTNIDLADGQYFTIGTARETCGPGGVTSAITLWLKADQGTKNGGGDIVNGNIDEWENASSNAGFPQITTNDQNPNKVDAGVNYNPYVEFDGSDEDLILNNVDADALFSDQDNTIFHAFNMITGGDGLVLGGWESASTSERLAYFEKNGSALRFDMIDNNNLVGTENIADRFVISTTLSDVSNKTLYINGNQDDQKTAASFTSSGNTGNFALGSRPGGSNYTQFRSGELIIFKDALSATDIRKVETYLAIKYGITLNNAASGEAGDYRSSSNTLLWDASDYTAYHNDVAGIGRDDGSCYVQRQSSSEESDILAIGLGNIASSNANNLNSFADNDDFLVWGNDNGPTSTTTSEIPSTISERMTRIWRVSDNGNVGNTELQFDLTGIIGDYSANADNLRLMIASNGSNGDMSSASLVGGGTFDGNVLSFTDIDLADGEYFTLGVIETCGPGGVNTNNAIWYRADLEVFNDAGSTLATNGQDVLQWNDQSSSANNASESNNNGGNPVVEPTYNTETFNNNAAIFFSDQSSNDNSYLESSSNSVDSDMTLVTVFSSAQSQGSDNDIENTPSLIGASTGTTTGYGLGLYNGEVVFNGANNDDFTVRSSSTYNDTEPYIASATRVRAASGPVELYVNSANLSSGTSSNDALGSAGSFAIGNQATYDEEAQFQGFIAESIVFSSVLSNEELARVESYLAIKYGITRTNDNNNNTNPNEIWSGSIREGDYVAADGGIIWDYSARGALFYNDIAGIGRDDLSCLNQTTSKSENNDAIVEMSISSFDNNDTWILWGNDNAPIEAPGNKERPTGINSRLNREWQAQETEGGGTLNEVDVTFDVSGITGTPLGNNNLSQVRMMVSTDDDFSTGVTLVEPSASNSGTQTITFNYDFNATEGYYFTLGSIEIDALPIELLDFSATSLSGEVILNWNTASESNNSFFSIERSNNGESFNQIASVLGAGNSASTLSYQYTDNNPLQGISYYRLKQVDFDGTYSYSSIVLIENKHAPPLSLSVYPNPVYQQEQVTLDFKGISDQGATVYIYSKNGQVIESFAIEAQTQKEHMRLNNLKSGLYFIRLVNSDQRSITKKIWIK